MAADSRARDRIRGHGRARLRSALWRILRETFISCFNHRVTGLAAEAGFFMLLSLPPLLLGLAGTIGYLHGLIGMHTIDTVKGDIIHAASSVLSQKSTDQVVVPLVNDVFDSGRADIVSVGFVIALWSGSRALNVYIDTITIMYGLSGRRGIVRTRLLSFTLYLAGLLVGMFLIPLLVAGPELVVKAFPHFAGTVHILYWPVLVVLSVCFLTTLYHVSVPVRTPWRDDIPGALVALLMLILGSFLLRVYLATTVDGPTVYGSLAAPVAVLIWMYLAAMSVLIGAAVNASIDQVWPSKATAQARAEKEKERAAAEIAGAIDTVRRAGRHRGLPGDWNTGEWGTGEWLLPDMGVDGADGAPPVHETVETVETARLPQAPAVPPMPPVPEASPYVEPGRWAAYDPVPPLSGPYANGHPNGHAGPPQHVGQRPADEQSWPSARP